MWKSENSGKKTVELDPSAAPAPARRSIRREPLPYVAPDQPRRGLLANVDFKSREWEIAMGVLGIVLFALAINAIIFGIGKTLVQ